MGWKNLKTKFNIENTISVNEKFIELASGVLKVNRKTGELLGDISSNFCRYNFEKLINASPDEILDALNEQDIFTNNIPVYVYFNGTVVEKFCEVFGFPNTTHDGEIMYQNTHFLNKGQAIDYGLNSEKINIEWQERKLEEYHAETLKLKNKIKQSKEWVINLNKEKQSI